ncbi:hypothetical protein E6H34_10400 [Candidatus Bathyarchaeota archaeon]|nr:MAG: hypothetical protein E6H34_10400 [Candidatus Bathyarchaeota archaeon]
MGSFKNVGFRFSSVSETLIYPLVLGHGERLFDETSQANHLKLAESKTFGTGVVKAGLSWRG